MLSQFDGTILLASHDRFLIDALATQVWEITPGALSITYGGYQEFLRARNRHLQQTANDRSQATARAKGKRAAVYAAKKQGLSPFEAARRAKKLESTIHELEANLGEISSQLDGASLAGDAGKVRTLGESYARTEAELDAALEEWGKLAE